MSQIDEIIKGVVNVDFEERTFKDGYGSGDEEEVVREIKKEYLMR